MIGFSDEASLEVNAVRYVEGGMRGKALRSEDMRLRATKQDPVGITSLGFSSLTITTATGFSPAFTLTADGSNFWLDQGTKVDWVCLKGAVNDVTYTGASLSVTASRIYLLDAGGVHVTDTCYLVAHRPDIGAWTIPGLTLSFV